MNNWDEWKFYNPDEDLDRLNEALNQPHIIKEFDEATRLFIRIALYGRDDGVADGFYDKQLQKKSPLRPLDVHPGDMLAVWYDECEVTPRKWHKYICRGSSDFMADAYLLLTKELFPESNWVTVRSKLRTAVLCFDKKLIFDFHDYAIHWYTGLTPQEILEYLHLKPTE